MFKTYFKKKKFSRINKSFERFNYYGHTDVFPVQKWISIHWSTFQYLLIHANEHILEKFYFKLRYFIK